MVTSQTTRNALLKIEVREREYARCNIVKRLKADADSKVQSQRAETKRLRALIKEQEKLIEEILTECHGLTYIQRRGCSHDELHPELREFDTETNARAREILTMK